MKTLLSLIATLYCLTSFAQEKPSDSTETYSNVQVQPAYPGGMQEFYKFIAAHYIIPKSLGKTGGRVIVMFVVKEDGSLSDFQVLRDIGHGTGEEVVRVLSGSPKWSPGLLYGKPVPVRYTVPISIPANN